MTINRFRGIERQQLLDERALRTRQRREWARKVGFPERQVDYAVITAEVIRSATHGKPVTKTMVLEQMQAAYPELMEGEKA